MGQGPESLDMLGTLSLSKRPVEGPAGRAFSFRGREREPLDRPFRQAQGPEPVEGLGALSLSNGRVGPFPTDGPATSAGPTIGNSLAIGVIRFDGRERPQMFRPDPRWFHSLFAISALRFRSQPARSGGTRRAKCVGLLSTTTGRLGFVRRLTRWVTPNEF